jgi:DnaJ-class molecular chaperone
VTHNPLPVWLHNLLFKIGLIDSCGSCDGEGWIPERRDDCDPPCIDQAHKCEDCNGWGFVLLRRWSAWK